MKKSKLAAIFIFMYSLSNTCKSQKISEDQIDLIKKATVFIQVKHEWLPTQDEYTPSGSGFFISSNGHVVTNYHVIQSNLKGDYS